MKAHHLSIGQAGNLLLLLGNLWLHALTVYADSPAISTQPVSVMASLGQAVSLTVSNVGTEPFSYQWLKDGVLLPDQTNATLAYASFQFTNSGTYNVIITNVDGLVISFPASLSVSNAPLRAWGNNGSGQLGIGRTGGITNQPTGVTNDVVSAAVGGSHSLFIKSDGTLWAMGLNNYGQLGIGSAGGSTNRPVLVTNDVVAAAAGRSHSLFIKSDGTLWAMGYNVDGQLGVGTTAILTNVPTPVTNNVVAVAAGDSHSLFVKADGTLWSMGNNSYGQLGDGTTAKKIRPTYVTSYVVAVAAGGYHSLFLKADAILWAMGQNGAGQLGGGTTNTSEDIPILVTNIVVAVAAGGYHSLFLKADGTLWAMGSNGLGQLGGTLDNTNQPVLVTNNVVAAAAGKSHSLFLTAEGALWAMGANSSGQLGIGTNSGSVNRPGLVKGGSLISAILAKGPTADHSLAIQGLAPVIRALTNQTVISGRAISFVASLSSGDGPFTYQWQFNGTNLLNASNSTYTLASTSSSDAGDYSVVVTGPFGSASASAHLTVLNPPLITSQPVSVMASLGQPVSLTVSNIGTEPFGYQWLKDGALLPDQTNATLAYASFQFTNSGIYNVVIRNIDGLVISFPASLSLSNAPLRAWGNNGSGQLGIGRTGGFTNQPSGVTNDVVSAAVGSSHSLFIKSDGTLWAMGDNSSGQLGIGTNTSPGNRPLPTFVTINAVAVAAGKSHSLFIKSDGTLWAMGYNLDGQLGVGSTGISTNRPVWVTNNVVAVAAGDAHSLFIKSDGTLWAMGNNGSGQLGDGTTAKKIRPTYVTNNVVAVAAGASHSLFLKADGTLWAMGYNYYGQLGIGSTTGRALPTFVTINAVAVAAGGYHSLLLKADGTLWAMGGQLGIGKTSDADRPTYVTNNVASVAAGELHSLFVTAEGALWVMGDNSSGQLGIGTNVASVIRPVLVNGGGLISATLAKGPTADHSLAIQGLAPVIRALTNQTVVSGRSISFIASLSSGDGPFTYKWQFNGTNLLNATNSNYTLASATPSDAGIYSVTVSAPLGSATASAHLTVLVPPLITSQPTSALAQVGQTVSLTVSNIGDEPFGYQWLKDGVLLSGQTNATLNYASFQFTDSGSYNVVVSNAGGLAISVPANLSLSYAPLRAWGNNGSGQLGIGRTGGTTNRPTVVTNDVVSAAAGGSHSLFIMSDGNLWAMGYNGSGQLGVGTTNTIEDIPILVTSNVVSAAAGGSHSLFIMSDGNLWAMGYNGSGQLGVGTTNTFEDTPILVTSNVVSAATGSSHSLLVKSDGTLWGMGYNNYGQLGVGSIPGGSTNVPVLVTSNVVAAAAGGSHSLFVKTDGTLWGMGYNNYGQLGNGTFVNTNRPILITSNVVAAAAGGSHSLFVKTDRTLWSMGANGVGQLGIGTTGGSATWPTPVTNNVVAVSAGSGHSLFMKADCTLWSMGYNVSGQLGIGTLVNTNRPVLVNGGGLITASLAKGPAANHSQVIAGVAPAVAALNDQTINLGQPTTFFASVLDGDGPFIYQWRLNGTNLVNATNSTHEIPAAALTDAGNYSVVVGGPFGNTSASAFLRVKAVFITSQPVGAVVGLGQPVSLTVSNGGVGPFGYQWLKDGVILLGQTNATLAYDSFQFTNSGIYNVVITNVDGLAISYPASLSISNAPLRAWGDNTWGALGIINSGNTNRPTPVQNNKNVVAAAGGFGHSLFLKADGTLFGMGFNKYGQLGVPTMDDHASWPINVDNNVAAMTAGDSHSLFVKSDGTLWAMGNNSFGQLGIGRTGGDTNLPVQVANDVVAVAAGALHSLFIKSDGSLWAMGTNNDGQLGVGAVSSSNLPAQVTTNVVSVAAGGGHSLFVKSDGTLWGTGNNVSGQLGVGSIPGGRTNRPIPVASNVVAAAAGVYHSLFLKADGTLWTMGDNLDGQLGIGTTGGTTNRPVQVTNNVVAVAAGARHSLFVKRDGSLWAMGYNVSGQLGIGTLVNTNRPVLVNGGGFITASLAKAPMGDHSLAIMGASPVVAALANRTVNLGQTTTFAISVSSGDAPFTYRWQLDGTNIANATNVSYTIPSAGLTDAGVYRVFVTSPFGATAASASLWVNRVPLASALSMGALTGEAQKLTIIGGENPPSDPDGDTLSVVSVTQGTNGATVIRNAASITYTSANTFNGIDTFSYVVGDGRGGFATNTVSVTVITRGPDYSLLSLTVAGSDSAAQLSYTGIPYCYYVLEWASNLTSPVDWLPVVTNEANSNGWVRFTNNLSASPQNFFRTRQR